jgi:hypothetical protein
MYVKTVNINLSNSSKISICGQNVAKIGKLITPFYQFFTISEMINMLRLKKVRYLGIRIALRLMYSTPNHSLGLFSGIAPIAERFQRRIETLKELNMGRCIAGYSNVWPLNIVSSESFTRYELPALLATHFVDNHMENARSGAQVSMEYMKYMEYGYIFIGLKRVVLHYFD